jgi:plasmid stabilization system protein ParE
VIAKVTFRVAAQRQAVAAELWWRAHRPSAPELLSTELERAIEQLSELPHAGPVAAVKLRKWRDVRTLVLPLTEYLLFYRIAGKEHVRILAIRHGRRKPA